MKQSPRVGVLPTDSTILLGGAMIAETWHDSTAVVKSLPKSLCIDFAGL